MLAHGAQTDICELSGTPKTVESSVDFTTRASPSSVEQSTSVAGATAAESAPNVYGTAHDAPSMPTRAAFGTFSASTFVNAATGSSTPKR